MIFLAEVTSESDILASCGSGSNVFSILLLGSFIEFAIKKSHENKLKIDENYAIVKCTLFGINFSCFIIRQLSAACNLSLL